jgi:hypothetical protein
MYHIGQDVKYGVDSMKKAELWVTKANGTRERFQREKVINTCLRMKADVKLAETIADKIMSRSHDGIPTRKILQKIHRYMRKPHPATRIQTDLRRAISMLKPMPDFELYVQMLLEEIGYEVSPNRLIRGECVTHEIDAVARKDDITYLVEVKHHVNPHTYTGLDVPRIAWATLDDLAKGFELGRNMVGFDRALIVCNTKFSAHAFRYSMCKGINLIGWKAPTGGGLEVMVEGAGFHPLTMLKGVDRVILRSLMEKGILLLRQLGDGDVAEISEVTGIHVDDVVEVRDRAVLILG